MTLAKEPAYKVKDLAERLGNDAVYEAIFSDLFEGKLKGKTYMLDYDENDQDFGGNFIRHIDDPVDDKVQSFDDFKQAHPEKNVNDPGIRHRIFLEYLSTLPARNNEPPEGLEILVNIVPVLRLWTRDLFRQSFVSYGDILGVTKETPYSDIAKISWERVGQTFKNILIGTKTRDATKDTRAIYIGGLYLSKTGVDDWLVRHGHEWPLGLTPTGRVPDEPMRERKVDPALIRDAKAARNEIKGNPDTVWADGKTNISRVMARLKTSYPDTYKRWGKTTLRTSLSTSRKKWDCD